MKKSYYMRKFHFSYLLPDGNTYKGFINIEADTKEELPDIKDVKGSFFVEKLKEGYNARFFLDDGEPNRSSYKPDILKGQENCIYTNGIYRPDLCSVGVGIHSTAQAEQILFYLAPVKYETIPRFEGRLEDHIYSMETHKLEYDVPDKHKGEER